MLEVVKEDIHLQTFLKMLRSRAHDLFRHRFAPFDVIAGDHDVQINSGNGLELAGPYSNRDRLFVDYDCGYGLLGNGACRGLTSVISTVEFDHTMDLPPHPQA